MKASNIDLSKYYDTRVYNFSDSKSKEALGRQLRSYKGSGFYYEISELNAWGVRGALVILRHEDQRANFVYVQVANAKEYGDLVSFTSQNSRSPFS